MDISDWQEVPRPMASQSGTLGYLSPTLIGVVGTLALHLFIVQSVYMSHLQHKTHTLDMQTPAPAAEQPSGLDGALVVVELAGTKSAEPARLYDDFTQSLRKPYSERMLDVELPAMNVQPASNEEDKSNDAASMIDPAEKSRLVGIYNRQIQARIERVWRRPRTPVSDGRDQLQLEASESFQCEARITQDQRGNVLDVLLRRCDGSVPWRQSLLTAIRQASPLPSAPNEDVFTMSFAMHFVGLPYAEGSVEDEYEEASVVIARTH